MEYVNHHAQCQTFKMPYNISYMSLQCKKCGKIYDWYYTRWCELCQINNFKENFTNWSSKNKQIDSFIQEMQLKIKSYKDIVFEWIPYNQFDNITGISKGDYATIYSAIWNDGLLHYNDNEEEYERKPNKKVTLKCIHNSQNMIDEFLDEVRISM